jgi:hypothetical protein
MRFHKDVFIGLGVWLVLLFYAVAKQQHAITRENPPPAYLPNLIPNPETVSRNNCLLRGNDVFEMMKMEVF